MKSDHYENFSSQSIVATETKSDRSEFIVRPVSCKCIKRNLWKPIRTHAGLSSSRSHGNTPSNSRIKFNCAPVAQLVEHWAAMWEVVSSDSGWTNTQGLKITEEKVLPFKLHPQMVETFKSSRIRTINCRPRLTTLECSQPSGT